ncbi:unnamed protein product [Mortierella alpina]
MRAYLYDNLDTDCREPHELVPSVPVSAEELAASGVLYWRLEDENFEAQIDKICEERNYKNRDQITVSKEGLGALFDEKIKTFFAEHLHEDEEIRAILDGTGYFDIRDLQDRWVRIKVEAGDLIVLVGGRSRMNRMCENRRKIRVFRNAHQNLTPTHGYSLKYDGVVACWNLPSLHS